MKSISIHGYVGVIGPSTNLNYFTGSTYSAFINDAKVFRTKRGAAQAMRYWQTADHNPRPLHQAFYASRQVIPVTLRDARAL